MWLVGWSFRLIVFVSETVGWADGSRSLLGYLEDADRWTDNPLHGMGL